MKLAPVLAQYLATHKVLSLPGLGTFHADNTYNPEVDYSKKGASLLDISFEQTKVPGLDEELVNFVSKETGKMKILAESDIRSQTEGVIDFLNTGKPYFLAGIGTLTKKMDGSFEFHKEKFIHTEKEKKKPVPITEKNSVPQSYIDESRKPRKTKPAAIIGAICLVAVAAVIWFYTQNKERNDGNIEEVTTASNSAATPPAGDSVAPATPKPATTATLSDSYRYVLEIAKQPRASKRFNQLKTINWPIEMETADSLSYKLFIKLPVAHADTTRIKDSLSALSGRKVWIER
ncbi:hypothetical protein U0035_08115 [Niabella yanshanensis]|uniref:CCDC81-like prokaryotic HU domain-containing protein n=1 Tax=Niabella yanshanensis TaxID=577386 RepID=A0ABZ0WBU5_9BACT|nr:hypothetical protein [Niabella yanshanensis]WQD40108.1 hypothetical protein U0035_08115 [Niabella yanshanensis]